MAQFQRHFVQELTKPLIVRQCGDLGFSGDNLSDVISVDLYTDGVAYSGGGTCAGACICPDGSTVALSGSVSGKTASVSLTEDCFAIPGQIGIGIRVTTGTTKTTVLKAIYNVEPFSTNNPVDPGSRIALDVGDLINRIDAAVESIPASADQLKAAMAPNFSNIKAYSAGEYVWNNGTLYKFTAAHAAGSWLGTDATAVALGSDVYVQKNTFSISDELSSGTIDTFWEQGGLYYGNGNPYSSDTNIRTQFIQVTANEPLRIYGLDRTAYKLFAHEYTSTTTQSGNAKEIVSDNYTPLTSLVRFRLVKKPDTDNIVPSDARLVIYNNGGYLYYFHGVVPTNTDLNTITESGMYYLASSNTYTNGVSGNNFGMLVVFGNGTGSTAQTLYTNGKDIYARSINSGTWTNWYVLNEQKVLLDAGANLNTLYQRGVYQFYGSNASGMTGLPDDYQAANPGLVYVVTRAAEGHVCFQILINSTNTVWTRYHNSDYDATDSTVGWTAWSRIAKKSEIDTINANVSTISANVTELNAHVAQAETDIQKLTYDYVAAASGRLPILYLTGDTSQMTKNTKVTLEYKYTEGNRTGTCTMKWQGASSVNNPKKNYTITFDNAFDTHGWGLQKKYVLKGYYSDFSHARDVCGAKLWGQIVRNRGNALPEADRPPFGQKNETLYNGANVLENNGSELTAYCYGVIQPNGGAVDGYPIIVVINDVYIGLYTFNIPKDAWMMGMGTGYSNRECILTSEAVTAATRIMATAQLDGSDWEVEYVSDDDESWISASFNGAIQDAIDCDTAEKYNALKSKFDMNSAMDYYIFSIVSGNWDGIGHNYFMYTYDGTKWYHGAYDMDNLFGMQWHGYGQPLIIGISSSPNISGLNNANNGCKLFQLLMTYDKAALKARYTELRNGLLSESNVYSTIYNFIGPINKSIYDQEPIIWPGIPGSSINNPEQMMDFYRMRTQYMDTVFNSL